MSLADHICRSTADPTCTLNRACSVPENGSLRRYRCVNYMMDGNSPACTADRSATCAIIAGNRHIRRGRAIHAISVIGLAAIERKPVGWRAPQNTVHGVSVPRSVAVGLRHWGRCDLPYIEQQLPNLLSLQVWRPAPAQSPSELTTRD